MPLALVPLHWRPSRFVPGGRARDLVLAVRYEAALVPLGGSDWYGEQQLGVELVEARVTRVDGQAMDFTTHNDVCEWFLWEEHSNEIACHVLQEHLRRSKPCTE